MLALRNRRIAVVIETFPALSEPWIVNHVVKLIEGGANVTIISSDLRRDFVLNDDVVKYKLIDRAVEIDIPVGRFRRVLGALSLFRKCGNKDRFLLLKTLNFRKFRKSALNLTLFYKAYHFLAQPTFDLIHCHFAPTGAMVASLKEIGAVTSPIVVTTHGYDVNIVPRYQGVDCYRHLFGVADVITAVSQFTRNKLVDLNCPPEKCLVWPMGVAFADFVPHDYSRTVSSFTLLAVGRLIEAKGFGVCIRAVFEMQKTVPNVRLLVAGTGPDESSLRELVRELRLEERIFFLGAKTPQELKRIYATSDVLVVPSIVQADGTEDAFPVVVLEGMASALPVIGSNIGGIPEAIDDGETGFLVPQDDPVAIARACIYLNDNPDVIKKMGLRGRKKAKENYGLDVLMDRMMLTYQGLVALERRSSN